MNIGIIGGGSTGLLLASYLSARHKVTVYVRRQEQKRTLNDAGLRLTDAAGTMDIHGAMLITELQEEDCYIICVKQNGIPAVIPQIKRVNKKRPFIFLQNGMGHLEEIKDLPHPVMLGVIEHGAFQHGDNLVEHTGKGKITLAAYKGEKEILSSLAEALHQHDFPFDYKEDYLTLLQKKLVINAVINPLTALFHVTNGEILHNRYLNKLAHVICKETCNVLNMDISEEWERVEIICKNTEKNHSSMLKDILDQRKTEIEAITGYIIEKGKDAAIPYTSFLYDSIKAIEIKKGITD